MNHEEEFDALARRKMEERSFAFQEDHWLQAKDMIETRRGKDRFGAAYWVVGSVALLFIAGLWWSLKGGSSSDPSDALVTESTVSGTAQVARIPEAAEQLQHGTVGAGDPSHRTAANAEGIGSIGPEEKSTGAQIKEHANRTGTSSGSTVGSSEGTVPVHVEQTRTIAIASTTGDPGAVPFEEKKDSGTEVAFGTPEKGNEASVASAAMLAEDRDVKKSDTPVDASVEDRSLATRTPDQATDGTMTAPALVTVEPAATIAVAEPDLDPVATADGGGMEAVNPSDITLPQDSVNTTTPVSAAPPLVPEAAPWEIGIIGGMLRTTSRYSGGNSDAWNNTIDPLWTAGGGMEIMHMGRNFGIGTGVFLGSYAERLHSDAITRTDLHVDRIWSFTPIDTTILFITDTVVQGSDIIYIGEGVPLTINVLTSTLDTTATEVVQREARVVENTVSYLEIPLLLDGHLTQGRWGLGLRGGPSLGLLTKRRGALPNASNDGYTPLADQQFRELALGYTLRAYVRYRFNAAWSVGLEPMLRGQLMNSLGEGDLSRVSSAVGGMFSLSYRLR